jgi:hypothetical protein
MANPFDCRPQLARKGEMQQVVICGEYCCKSGLSRHNRRMMRITVQPTDESVLEELGARLAGARLVSHL